MGLGRKLGLLRAPVDAIRGTLAEARRRVISARTRRRQARWAAQIRASVASCGEGLYVGGPSQVYGGRAVTLGSNVNFNGMTVWGAGGVTIGDNFHSGRDCKIISQNHNYDGGTAIPYDSSYVYRPVTIGDNVWLGHNVIVLPGSTIGEGAVIGAGAVVVGKIERCAVAAGNPARTVKYRDVEHYESLKAQGLFH